VKTLAHPNGWWRDTAQQLLVQRGDRSAVPALKQLAAATADWRTRLHALWTLDGLDSLEPDLVQRALADKSPEVRAAGVRLSERWIAEAGHPLAAAVLKLADDPSWTVRRQLAATIGELPAASRLEPAVALLTRYASDPITVDVAISGLRGAEAEVLKRVMQADGGKRENDAVVMLSGAVARAGDVQALQQVIGRLGEPSTSPAHRAALLQGLELGLPGGAGGRGGRGGGGRGAPPAKPATLPAEPGELTRLVAAGGETGAIAKRVLARIDWPGKPAPTIEVAPLTPVEEQRFATGAEIYKNICVGCHQPDGRGKEKMAPPLVESRYAAGDPGAAMRILLAGKEGPTGLMPPLGAALNDEQIASVLTYIRREWGNTGSPVAPDDVTEIRGLTKTRTRPWTDAELTPAGRGGRGRGAF
jgi:mono/diheme cytochrome c family protein